MPMRDMQRTNQQTGEIRWGTSTPGKNGGKQPMKLPTLRLTANSLVTAKAISERYEGEVVPWERKWEVITKVTQVPVMLPTEGEIFSQWWEKWSAARKRERWCDSQQQRFGRGVCLCPHAEDPDDAEAVEAAMWERLALAKEGKACKPRTDLLLRITNLPGIGVWRATTHSRKAAQRMQAVVAAMEIFRQQGIYLNATFMLTWEQTEIRGKLQQVIVPALEADDSLESLALGTAGHTSMTQALISRAGGDTPTRAAITAGSAKPAVAALPAPDPLKDPALKPADLARLAAEAASEEEHTAIWAEVKDRRWETKEVFPPETGGDDTKPDLDGADEEAVVAVKLDDYMRTRWYELHEITKAAAAARQQAAPASADEGWPAEPSGGDA